MFTMTWQRTALSAALCGVVAGFSSVAAAGVGGLTQIESTAIYEDILVGPISGSPYDEFISFGNTGPDILINGFTDDGVLLGATLELSGTRTQWVSGDGYLIPLNGETFEPDVSVHGQGNATSVVSSLEFVGTYIFGGPFSTGDCVATGSCSYDNGPTADISVFSETAYASGVGIMEGDRVLGTSLNVELLTDGQLFPPDAALDWGLATTAELHAIFDGSATVTYDYLLHANPELQDGDRMTVTDLYLDFGTVEQGAMAPTLNFFIGNADTMDRIEWDLSVMENGDTSRFSGMPMGDLFGQSGLLEFLVNFDTSLLGDFNAYYDLLFSDSFMYQPEAAEWTRNRGEDYGLMRIYVQGSVVEATGGVPEPGTLALLAAGALGFGFRRHKKN